MVKRGHALLRRTAGGGDAGPVVQHHVARLTACLRDLPAEQVAAVAERLWAVVESGGQILIAGNGGSAATASHMALDLSKSTLGRTPGAGGPRVRALALNDPGPVITAWANDHGYHRVFAEQIATLARPGDAAVLLSVSGTSPNVVAAAPTARAARAAVIALVGRPGGTVRELADLAVVVPSEDYQLVEDVHLSISHMVTRYLMQAVASARTSAGRAEPRQVPRSPHPTTVALGARGRRIGNTRRPAT